MARPASLLQPDPGQAALHGELRAELAQALASLSPALRAVILLRDVAELSTAATAAELGITPGAVKVRLHRARLRLRTLLAGYVASAKEE